MAKGYKTGGRGKGTPNKITSNLRQLINDFLLENWTKFLSDFQELEPKDRISFYEKLLQYGLPKLQSTELKNDFESFSEEQLDYIINELKRTKDE